MSYRMRKISSSHIADMRKQQRVKTDYTAIVKALKNNTMHSRKDLYDCLTEFRMIRQWFHNGDYLKIFMDSVTGDERLEMLDRQLGVTKEWARQMIRKTQKE